MEDNPVEKLLWGKFNIEKATAFCFYKRGSDFKEILYQLKYKGDYELGINLGKQIATELSQSDFFNGIDLLIPVPLHKKKHKKRGYNQSEQLAAGIFHIINIPLDNTSVIRTKDTDTQTHKSALERWENVENIFAVKNPNPLHHKHILLIDDVITTGSTLVECACELQKIPGIKISILTLALAHQ